MARQVPKRDAKVILLPLPAPERVPPLIFTADHQVAQAPLRRMVIRGSFRMGNKDEQLLDMPAQSAGTVSPGLPTGPPGKAGTA